jgi:4-diphosphocytidyl-2-C-methyl-D-erythritol kinase
VAGIAEEDDLCVRAAHKLKAASGSRLGADLALRKVLPIGGGLGGGSSDAATVLLVLNRLWRAGFARADLMALAGTLGADVPFFVYGRNALGEGTGERLTALALPSRWYVVLVPDASVGTASSNAMSSSKDISPCHGTSLYPPASVTRICGEAASFSTFWRNR